MSQLNLSLSNELKFSVDSLETKNEKKISQELERNFKEIAEELINHYCIVKKKVNAPDVVYRFMELEFYYCSRDHFDVITYPRKAEAGDWFFHSSGVDICFKSNVEFAEDSAKPIGSPKDYVFGGILIRSLSKHEGDKITYITGPKKCCYELFDKFSAFASSEDFPPKDFPMIEKRKNENVVKVISCGRYFDLSQTTLEKKFKSIYETSWREGEKNNFTSVEKSTFYKNYWSSFENSLRKNYCFIDQKAFEEYLNDSSADYYSASPLKKPKKDVFELKKVRLKLKS